MRSRSTGVGRDENREIMLFGGQYVGGSGKDIIVLSLKIF